MVGLPSAEAASIWGLCKWGRRISIAVGCLRGDVTRRADGARGAIGPQHARKARTDLDRKFKNRHPLFLRLHIRRMRAGIGNLRGSLVNLRFVSSRPLDENRGEFPIRC